MTYVNYVMSGLLGVLVAASIFAAQVSIASDADVPDVQVLSEA